LFTALAQSFSHLQNLCAVGKPPPRFLAETRADIPSFVIDVKLARLCSLTLTKDRRSQCCKRGNCQRLRTGLNPRFAWRRKKQAFGDWQPDSSDNSILNHPRHRPVASQISARIVCIHTRKSALVPSFQIHSDGEQSERSDSQSLDRRFESAVTGGWKQPLLFFSYGCADPWSLHRFRTNVNEGTVIPLLPEKL
jgi:hypothetical protein